MGIDADSLYERFEVDQAVAGLGRYIDGKLDMIDEKTLKPVYPTLASVLALVRDPKKPKTKRKLSAPPPTFKRRKKK